MIAVAILLAQVAGPPAPRPETPTVSQTQIDDITDACEVPHDWLKLVGANRVRVQPSPKAPYDTIHCLVQKLHDRGYPTELGFNGSDQRLESKDGGVTVKATQQ